MLFADPPLVPIDFQTLRKGPKPNQYLVCPPGYCDGPPDRTAPEFDVPAEALIGRIAEIVDAEPQCRRRAVSDDGLQIDWLVHTRLLGFPDSVTVRTVPLAADRAAPAIFSRSHIGYSDLGTNRRRVERWLAALESRP